jgi:hypothetical protein
MRREREEIASVLQGMRISREKWDVNSKQLNRSLRSEILAGGEAALHGELDFDRDFFVTFPAFWDPA